MPRLSRAVFGLPSSRQAKEGGNEWIRVASPFPQIQALMKEIQLANPGYPINKVREVAAEFLASGRALPQIQTLSSNTVLYKVVPKGEGVNPTTGYWMTQQQASQIARMTPQQAADTLGLPLAQAARMLDKGMDFYAVTPKSGVTPTAFASDIAPATQAGINIGGGARQIVIPNRTRWNEPKAINPNVLRLL